MKTLSNKKCLFIIAAYFIISLGIGNLIPESFVNKDNFALIELGLDSLTAFIYFMLVKDELRGEFNIFKADIKFNLTTILKKTFTMWIVCDLIAAVASLLFTLLTGNIAINNANSDALITLIETDTVLMIITAVIIAPFIEEILFRGAIYKLFSKINEEVAVLATSLIFALLHFSTDFIYGNISPNMIPSLIAYLALSYTITNNYYHNRNIFFAMGMHGLYNLISIVLTLLLL